MTPKFAKAVDRVFLFVMDLLQKIEQGQPIDVADARNRTEKHIDAAEGMIGQTADWDLAKYALVAWVDSMLIENPWEGQNWWENNPLERKYFFGRNAFTQFFTKARDAAALPTKDALEVYYICTVLGFRGMYGEAASAQMAAQMGLPPKLEEWARQIATSIQLGHGRPPIEDAPVLGDGAPPLDGKSQLIAMATVSIGLLTAAVGYFYYFVWLK